MKSMSYKQPKLVKDTGANLPILNLLRMLIIYVTNVPLMHLIENQLQTSFEKKNISTYKTTTGQMVCCCYAFNN